MAVAAAPLIVSTFPALGPLPAHASEETPPPASEETPPDVIPESGIVSLSESQVEQVLADAEQPDGTLEEQAVERYLNGLPDEGSYLTPQDLEVGSIEVVDGLTATIVAPEALVVRKADFWVDAGSNEVSAAAQWRSPTLSPPQLAPVWGPGPRGATPPAMWCCLGYTDGTTTLGKPSSKPNGASTPTTETPTRTFGRSHVARATPDEIEHFGPDEEAYVQKLWVSSRLKDDVQNHAQQWRQDLTHPEEGFTNCSNNVTINLGVFSFTPEDCADYDVWQGDVGHQRFDYDQGFYAGGETRAIAYVSGFQMDNGTFPAMNWYEFVTLRLGGHTPDSSADYKCTSEEVGFRYDTQELRCDW